MMLYPIHKQLAFVGSLYIPCSDRNNFLFSEDVYEPVVVFWGRNLITGGGAESKSHYWGAKSVSLSYHFIQPEF